MTTDPLTIGFAAGTGVLIALIIGAAIVKAEDERLTECLRTTDDKCACLAIKNRNTSEACYDAKKKETP